MKHMTCINCNKYNMLDSINSINPSSVKISYISYGWLIPYVSHFIHILYSILYIFATLNYFHTKCFILYNIISLCKTRPFPSCDVEFLNSCFYRAWWWLYKPKPGCSIIFNKAKKKCWSWLISSLRNWNIYLKFFPLCKSITIFGHSSIRQMLTL
jgi:hypothetical protein